jgi:two-component system NtrC family sensor kinase
MSRVTNKGFSIRSKTTIYATIIAIAALAAAFTITLRLATVRFNHAIIDNQFQNLSALSEQLITVFALLGAVAGLVMWLVMGKIMSPLQMLIDQIESIHTKTGRDRFLPDSFDGDPGRLRSAFNKMVAEFDLQQEILILMQSEMEQQKVLAEGILDKAAVPIIVLDVNHRITVWNNAVEDLTGLLSDEMIGTSRQWLPFYESERPVLADLVLSGYEPHPGKLYGTYRMSLHVPGGLQAEGWFKNVGGQRRYLLFDAAPVFDSNNVMLGVIETLLDITDRKQAEAELSRSREKLQHKHNELEKLFDQVAKGKRDWEDTMDSLSEMVLVCDPFGAVTRCNRAVTTFTGLPYVEIINFNFKKLFAEAGLELNDHDGTSGQMECEGDLRHFELLSNELKQIGTDDIRGVVITVHETTELFKMNENLHKAHVELQRTQAQAFQQEKMASIGQLAAGVAHEINNPMGFISSNLTTMGKYMEKIITFEAALIEAVQDKGDPKTATTLNELRKKMKIDIILNDISSLLEESQDGAERVRRIVQDLMSFSHVDEAECKAVSINQCLDSTLNMLRNEIKYVADVEREYDPDLPMLDCFPHQIKQVFMNILVNAAHAIEGHGIITVKTFRDNDHIVVRFRDTGKGIAPENLTRIFEPFFTTKEIGKGTGLGLSISYDIIKKHGGVIAVESELCVGTAFTVRLPILQEETR